MKKERMPQIIRLQENLSSIRKTAGWTAEELGSMLGVSKQNISNLEKGITKLSQAQYIAIRHLADYKARKDPENTALLRIMDLLVDRTDIPEDDYNSLKGTAKNIGAAAATMQVPVLNIFAETLLKASYTRADDLTEIEGSLRDTIVTKEENDWTAELIGQKNDQNNKKMLDGDKVPMT